MTGTLQPAWGTIVWGTPTSQTAPPVPQSGTIAGTTAFGAIQVAPGGGLTIDAAGRLRIYVDDRPTTPHGLTAGDVWNNGGEPTIVETTS